MSKYSPKNREEAFTYQFEEDVRVLRCLAMQGTESNFEKGLKTLEAHISAYRNKELKKEAAKAVKKHKATTAYMKQIGLAIIIIVFTLSCGVNRSVSGQVEAIRGDTVCLKNRCFKLLQNAPRTSIGNKAVFTPVKENDKRINCIKLK